MKIGLGMIVGNDERALVRHLPIISSYFDSCIAIDSYSKDGSINALIKNGFNIFQRKWNNNYAEARNEVIKKAEEMGMEGLLMLDADECMFPDDIRKVKKLLEEHEAIKLPRYEFGPNNEYYNPKIYPDYQGRAFQLNKEYHYRNPLHEILYKGEDIKAVSERDGFFASSETHIFHYGRCKSPKEIWLKYHNYGLILRGEKTITKIPPNINFDVAENFTDVIKFPHKQPV